MMILIKIALVGNYFAVFSIFFLFAYFFFVLFVYSGQRADTHISPATACNNKNKSREQTYNTVIYKRVQVTSDG
jgi:hypothetical protein